MIDTQLDGPAHLASGNREVRLPIVMTGRRPTQPIGDRTDRATDFDCLNKSSITHESREAQ
jgi:hypothetical protein